MAEIILTEFYAALPWRHGVSYAERRRKVSTWSLIVVSCPHVARNGEKEKHHNPHVDRVLREFSFVLENWKSHWINQTACHVCIRYVCNDLRHVIINIDKSKPWTNGLSDRSPLEYQQMVIKLSVRCVRFFYYGKRRRDKMKAQKTRLDVQYSYSKLVEEIKSYRTENLNTYQLEKSERVFAFFRGLFFTVAL